jgi:hypothetical protein
MVQYRILCNGIDSISVSECDREALGPLKSLRTSDRACCSNSLLNFLWFSAKASLTADATAVVDSVEDVSAATFESRDWRL